jgi:hypothetical protein
VAGLPGRRNDLAGHVLIRQKFRDDLHRQRVNVLLLDGFGSIMQSGLNIVAGQVRVILENLFVRPTVRKQFHEEFDSDPRPFDDGFPDEHLRIDTDSILPRHKTPPFLGSLYPFLSAKSCTGGIVYASGARRCGVAAGARVSLCYLR